MRLHLLAAAAAALVPLAVAGQTPADHPLKAAKVGDYATYALTQRVGTFEVKGTVTNTVKTVTDKEVTLEVTNPDAFDHDFVIDELDVKVALPAGETTKVTFQAGPGTYTFYCSIPGHREAGMEGTLTVLPGAGH